MSIDAVLMCNCGRITSARLQTCSHCGQALNLSSQRTSRSQSIAPTTSRYSLSTVDWSQASRRSLDMAQPRRPYDTAASDTFTRAFTSEPDEDGTLSSSPRNVDMFPASVYRNSSRTSSRTSSIYSLTPTPSTSARSPSDGIHCRPAEVYSSSAAGTTPASLDRGYSPMAAGFARLRRSDASPSSTSQSAARGSVSAAKEPVTAELGAKLFAGPA